MTDLLPKRIGDVAWKESGNGQVAECQRGVMRTRIEFAVAVALTIGTVKTIRIRCSFPVQPLIRSIRTGIEITWCPFDETAQVLLKLDLRKAVPH